jgi:glutamate synthase (NADPH/NADH) large chain
MDLSPILFAPEVPEGSERYCVQSQDHSLEKALDNQLIQLSQQALDSGEPVRIQLPVRNVNRTVGTMLGSEITRRGGLPDGTIDITLTGSAGQSFGAFIPQGLTLRLEGDANDYVGKGLSGGRIIIRPDRGAVFKAEDHTIAGNVLAYGATGGEMFIRGRVGERFCVRNSGVKAVVEGVGDHGCEYMTGGTAVILGEIGRNFAAGMSGGIAFVLDLDSGLVNPELVELNELSESDAEELRCLIVAHVESTESERGRDLIESWDSAVHRFTKVIPRDYKRILAIEAQARITGEDPMVAIMSSI